MSKTHKIQRAYEAHKNSPYPIFSPLSKEVIDAMGEIWRSSTRYGNKRRAMRTLKKKERKSKKLKEKAKVLKEIKQELE